MTKYLIILTLTFITVQASELNVNFSSPILYTNDLAIHKKIKKTSTQLNKNQLKILQTKIPELEVSKDWSLSTFTEVFTRILWEYNPSSKPAKINIFLADCEKIQLKPNKFKNQTGIEILKGICLENKIKITLDNGFIILHKEKIELNKSTIKPTNVDSNFYNTVNINVKSFYYSNLPIEDLVESLKKIQKDYNPNHNSISYKIIKKENSNVSSDEYDFVHEKTVYLSGSNIPFLQILKLSCFQLGYSMEIKNKTIILSQQ